MIVRPFDEITDTDRHVRALRRSRRGPRPPVTGAGHPGENGVYPLLTNPKAARR